MSEKIISKEQLKYILYTVFENYNNLSKKIYIIVGEKEGSSQIIEEILKKINQNTPHFIKDGLMSLEDKKDGNILKLKRKNRNLEVINDEKEINYEKQLNQNIIKIYIKNTDFNNIEKLYDYKTKFIVNYILDLDEVGKTRFFKELDILAKNDEKKEKSENKNNQIIEKHENKNKVDAKNKEIIELNNTENLGKNIEKNNFSVSDLYNICKDKALDIERKDIRKIENWIYNIITPNSLDEDLFKNMLDTINKQLNSLNFDLYLHYILEKEENKTLDYISPKGDLYKLLLFEDMIRIDYKDVCKVKIDLDVDYLGKWWSENILPIFKQKYNKQELANKLELEIKKNEILDFHGKNFEKLKYKIIEEIQKEYANEKKLDKDFESEEKALLEENLKNKNTKTILELQLIIKEASIKYKNNKEILKEYCSDKFINILEDSEEKYTLKELEQFLKNNEMYFNKKVYVYFEVCIQKQIQKLEEKLLNDICEVKSLNQLQDLHNKLLENGEFVKCEDLETIIFRKMESIIKTLNLADINDSENIKIGNSIYNNMSTIDLGKYPIAEILICRVINIDLSDEDNSIEDLKSSISEIKEVVLNNCIFNCEYYNLNIQINNIEDLYDIKFRYLKDLIEYIKMKKGNTFLIGIKNINKNNQYKKRVFNKVNMDLLREIDKFYEQKKGQG